MPNMPLISGPMGTLLEVLLSSSDISDITSVGSGQIITNAERIALNAAIQPGDNISLLNNNVGYTTVEAAQDAVFNAFVDTETLAWTYNDGADSFSGVATPIFGQGAQDFLDTTNVSYTTNTYFLAYDFTTAVQQIGRYRVQLEVSYEPGAGSNNDDFELRIDGTIIGTRYEDEGKDTGSDIRKKVTITAYFDHTTISTFDIQHWARQSGGGTTVLHDCSAEVWRVS